MQFVFWISVSTAIYAFAGYPLLLSALGLVFRRDVRKAPVQPTVSLLIPAYNEARVMARKIENSRALHYPAGRIEMLVVSDGSTDATAQIASAMGVEVLLINENRGKVAALNAALPLLRGEIVVFSDASAMLAPDSVMRLVQNFADPSVGAASGHIGMANMDEVNIGVSEGLYWKYEAFLKTRESRLDSTVGAHGPLHSIRKGLYPFPPPETINDDYVIPLSVISRGFRAVYEPEALVFDDASEMTGFGRRVRIMAGNLQQLGYIRDLISLSRPLPCLFFLSHKVIRLAVPFAMLSALFANAFLLGTPAYRALFWGQIVFYLLAFAGLTGRLRPRALRLPYYFCMVNSAAFFGLYHAITDRRRLAWK